MNTKALLKKNYDALCARKAAIDAQAAPLTEKREALWEKIHPLKAQIDKIAAEEKALKGEDYFLLCREIGQLAKTLGGKGIGDNRTQA